jgi:tRNA A-37 threonylcarbamoyl transferase component Bud32
LIQKRGGDERLAMISVDTLNSALADRYLVERELGSGGMATVYFARDVRHERRVALKVLRPELAAVIGAARFAQEIRTTANLQHPHILPLHDSGEISGTVFYVMPYVEGETLRDRLTRETQLPIDDAVQLLQHVASALDYAHRQGIVHRDIKPENILLQDGQALVADFGIALAASRSDSGSRLTETGMSLGTPSYMSPEQAMGQREIGPGADIYALGCVLYEMLAGEPPFTAPTAQAVVARLITEKAPDVRRLRARVPDQVALAIETALEKLPADRFVTAREFGEALTNPSVTMPMSVTSVATSRLSHRRVVGAVAGGVALGALAMFSASRLRNRADAPREWSAELLGGALPAMFPRLSPDGQHLAYAAHLGRQTQVAIMSLASGDRAILTSDTTRGLVTDITWSRDNARIYYTRFFEAPQGVYYVSRLGGEEQLLLEDAGSPEILPDGSMLVTRPIAGRRLRIARFWPETGRIDSLDATLALGPGGPLPLRAFPDGEEFAFYGRTSDDSVDALRVMEVTSGRARLISDSDGLRPRFGITADGRSILADKWRGGMHHLIEYPRKGGTPKFVLNLPFTSAGMFELGADGSLYLEQGMDWYDRPSEIVRFQRGERRVLTSSRFYDALPLMLPGGRLLVEAWVLGERRIMVHAPNAELVPFVQGNQATRGPMAMLGRDHVILAVGSGDSATLAIASLTSRKIVRRFSGVRAFAAAGSPDGSTVYFASRDTIFSVPAAGGESTALCAGDGVAVDPHGRYLVISRSTGSGLQVVRRSLGDGSEETIRLAGNLRFALSSIAPNSIARDGRILALVISPASWSWPVAVIEPKTGSAELLPIYDGWAGWTPEGDVVGVSWAVAGRLWRFRPRDLKTEIR